MSSLTLSLLGGFRVTINGEPINAFESVKVRALLAYLAVEADRSHRRETLAGLLWPERPERNARQNLSQALFNLRKVIGDRTASPPFFLITPQTIRFNPASDYLLDVTQFTELLAACETHNHHQLASCNSCLEHMQQAMSLSEGNFLEGFSLKDSTAFEEWALLKRERYHRQVLDTLHQLVNCYRQCREYEQAILYARQQVELDPWREQAHQQLMIVLALDGQRTQALAQYEICCRLLAEELGVEPAEETSSLYEQIKEGVFDVPITLSTLPAFLDEDADDELERPVFVARERELADLEAALDTARAGQGQILFVIGGAGRGKTMLVQEFARRAQTTDPELIAISGNCNLHTGSGDPYLPFREALSLLAGEVEAKWAGGLITQAHARRLWEALPLTLPALVEYAPELIGSFVPGPALQARAVTFAPQDASWFQRLTSITSAEPQTTLEQKPILSQYTALLKAVAARRPLLLIIEDLHWVDTSSSDLLFHLSRQIGDSRILIVGTYRPEEMVLSQSVSEAEQQAGHRLANIVSELKRRHGDIWLDLGKLAQAEGHRFVEAYLDTQPNRLSPAFRKKLFGHTGGHALFTVELLREMADRRDIYTDEASYWVEGQTIDWQTLPVKVEGVIERRINRLEKSLQTMLTIASVEGESFTAEVVARVQQLDERGLIQRLSQELDRQHRLVTAQTLERLNGQRLSIYRFRHQLFQHFLYHRLDETERAYLHEEVGMVLEALYGAQTEQVAAQLARHFKLAGLTDKAADYLYRAGEQAATVGAFVEAVDYLEQGLQLVAGQVDTEVRRLQAGLHYRLGTIYSEQGKYAAGDEHLESGLSLAREVGDTQRSIEALAGLGQCAAKQGNLNAAENYLQEALALARDTGDKANMAFALLWLGITASLQGESDHGAPYGMEALALARETGDKNREARTLNMLGEVARLQKRYDEAATHYQESLSIFRALDNRFGIMVIMNNLGHIAAASRDVKTATGHYLDSMRIAREIQVITSEAETLAGLAGLKVIEGEPERALELLGVALHHPAFNQEAQRVVDPILAQLHADLSPEIIEAGLERGESLDFDTVVKELLAEGQT